MPTLHITRGLPGSGKTTFARQWVARSPATRTRVNRDDLRTMMYGAAIDLTQEQEDLVTTASQALVRNLLALGLDVIADDTNLLRQYVEQWRAFAEQCFADFELHVLDTPVEVCAARDAARERSIGEDAIRSLAQSSRSEDERPEEQA